MNTRSVLDCGSPLPLFPGHPASSAALESARGPAQSKTWRGFVASLVFVTAALTGQAQSYSIDWFTIDGGGGTSTGGVYSVSGTLGQSDAGGPLTNGQYSVTDGFWPGVNLVQTVGAPLLASELLPGGSVRIFWPLPASGFVLDQTSALGSPPVAISWSQVSFPYQTNSTHISITVPPGVGSKFYRLRKP